MRLASCLSAIRDDLLYALEACGIRTDRELLFSTSSLELYKRLPSETTTLHELDQLRTLVAESAAASASVGPALLAEECRGLLDVAAITSGVVELDDLLEGFGTPGIVQISGDKNSGKTVSATVIEVVV